MRFAKNKFNAVLEANTNEKLRYQGEILDKVFYRLYMSFTLFEVISVPLVVFLFVVSDPADYYFAVPPEGEINILLSGAQILRNSVALYIPYAVMVYLDEGQRGPSSRATKQKKIKTSYIGAPTRQPSASENPLVRSNQGQMTVAIRSYEEP
eukprot:snap_masked-scaffold_39-processed-gene-1.40-mRNA-1 protein AED:1.00 eAED:1.00 QI:0/-1/0/0/-1/1/1/0/151